ncbi:hypothetical protein [Catenisphaera adipataccumulans]|jgi:hypothetical protein|uniref:Biotin synthase-like enzyme n=1 Tax=Catenisphaera adipataccumulans TaxID=700500 RepID=A0A7W8FU75_9FIRM|nr:hypothetical protein [Catenisphaera adipataccumulans]MBB5182304.1 biotin synthase-like enzyme [Catenisphaera adipataccumulans]
MSTVITMIVIAILFILAVRHVIQHGACDEDCSHCGHMCSAKGGETLYERYRKDHPKKITNTAE